jgi:hypothetical protein
LTNIGFQDAIFAWPQAMVSRFDELVRASTQRDPQWTAGFLRWLRTKTPMRYPALVGAATFVSERLVHEQHGMSRQLIDSVLCRADDPGHLLAHWIATYGSQIPQPVKRGVADAVVRLYDRRALRYDTDAHHMDTPNFINFDLTFSGGIRTPRPLRFGDVIALVHPVARDQEQGELFRHVRAARHRRVAADHPVDLTVPRRRADREVWDRLVASMSVADLLTRLRRFDSGGIPFETAMTVAARIADPTEVSESGLLPLKFFTARRALRTQRWFPALAAGAAHNVSAIPEIPGRTLIAAEARNEACAVFALTLAQRCTQADVVAHAGEPFEVIPGESPLDALTRWQGADFSPGTPRGLDRLTGHDRVVIVVEDIHQLEDIQLPPDVPVYAWRAVIPWRHYRRDDPPEPGRLIFSGLTDLAFSVIPWAEAARKGQWPWENNA